MQNIILRNQGDSVVIQQSGKELSEYSPKMTKVRAILEWQAGVDLDIHAFYRLRGSQRDGHVCFNSKGSKSSPPYIHLDKDMGVGNVGGDNQEIITIGSLEHVENILIATNIFRFLDFLSEDDHFAKYDGVVKIITDTNNEISIPLTSTDLGKWCVIALIDNTDPYTPLVSNINRVTDSEPVLDDYLDSDVLELTYDN